MMTKPPEFLYRQVGRQLVFLCPHCRRDHYHGLPEGHRMAHCVDRNSPLHLTGYVLKLHQGTGQRAAHATAKTEKTHCDS